MINFTQFSLNLRVKKYIYSLSFTISNMKTFTHAYIYIVDPIIDMVIQCVVYVAGNMSGFMSL